MCALLPTCPQNNIANVTVAEWAQFQANVTVEPSITGEPSVLIELSATRASLDGDSTVQPSRTVPRRNHIFEWKPAWHQYKKGSKH